MERYTNKDWKCTEKDHLCCYNKLAEIEDKLDNGKLIELPYLHHHEKGVGGIDKEFWQIIYMYKGVFWLTHTIFDKDTALRLLAEIKEQENER
jgi:hypothetical protein